MKYILVACLGVFIFSSCEKCVTCSYSVPNKKPYSSSYCSKRSKDLTAFKKSVSDEAQRYGTSAECIDKEKK
ncbi:MAG: hypothetical protein IT238_11870 [Bacteroidia bacterium]|nr:hypothetical protein [Bacteroidia bacterium]